jgi:transcriptional regulator with XRE-family HTH domain
MSMLSDIDGDGTRQHRQLRLALRELRRAADLTQAAVASRAEWCVSKVLRIENGDVRISVSDLRALLALYGVQNPTEVARLTDLARAARRQPWRAYRDVHSPAFLRFLAYEQHATRAWYLDPHFVPALLRTEPYTRALLRGSEVAPPGPDTIDRIIEAGRRRQRILHGPDAPWICAYLDEAAVTRTIGDLSVMRDQLDHLIALSHQPNITIRVVPWQAGAYPGLQGPFARLSFDEPDEPDVLYQENSLTGAAVSVDVQRSRQISRHLAAHMAAVQALARTSLTEPRSRDLIDARRQSLASSKDAAPPRTDDR